MFLCIRSICLFLEVTCHGVFWLSLAFGWLSSLIRLLLLHYLEKVSFVDPITNIKNPDSSLLLSSGLSWPQALREETASCFCLSSALIFDLVIIGLLKLIFRRQRPSGNKPQDMRMTISVDSYSFPSG
ncbi:unnamed protein product [Protopolystoma xenopodis]|uniref:Uncharacterized protein n=1 Tax=Protopolystoma xenopodis TaxID=117903 RepID=A0A3S5CL48_9PLAT|nr:unnamed protein product [Protopolystoma xenopodis]